MRHYQHHIGDYEAATSHLTWEEDLAYTRLLRVYFRDEKLRAFSLADVFRLIRAKSKKQKKATETVLEEFFTRTESGWINNRAEKELRKYRERSNKAAEAANQRWAQDANASPEHCFLNANAMPPITHKPITNKKDPLTPKGGKGISLKDLSNPEAVEAWRNLNRKGLKLKRDHATLVWLNAAAIKALERGDDPVGYFIKLAQELATGNDGIVGDDFYQRAKQRLNATAPGAALAETNGVDDDEAD